jgi:hypothetical protein
MRLARWDDEFSSEKTNEILQELALSHLSLLGEGGGPQASEIRDLLESRDLKALCDYELDYSELTTHAAIHLRQVLAFFQKRQDLDLGIDRGAVALEKFKASEELCLQTNRLFKGLASGRVSLFPDVSAVFHRAMRKIAQILGEVPSLSDLHVRFGSGATTQVPKRIASARRKLSQTFACSEEFLSVSQEAIEELQGWIPFPEDSDSVSVSLEVHSGVLNFVPKTAKTDRAIVVEPMLNTMFQLGIGDYIARRLRPYGVDIRDQTKNQNFACLGSLTGALATLDLSSASDTIATELVYHLLPIDWVIFLSRFRTGTILTKEGPIRLQKFSSMGNGYTFPLETLIFYALSQACVKEGDDHLVAVYGDDIIVPTYAVELLVRALRTAGFVLNPQKSFSSGPFRESCGKDYLRGIDIRPSYVKAPLSGISIFVLHNFYVRHGLPDQASYLLRFLSPQLLLWGPDGYGDGHLIGEWSPRPKNRDKGWSGYTFDTFTLKNRKDWQVLPGDRVLPSYSVYVSPSLEGLPGLPGTQRSERINALFGRRAAFHNVAKAKPDYRKGVLGVSTSGTQGYKRISIYVLVA